MGAGFDPEGLLPPLEGGGGGHFARRGAGGGGRGRAGAAAPPPPSGPAGSMRRAVAAPRGAEGARDGVGVASLRGGARAALERALAGRMGDLSTASKGLRAHSLDPPVLSLPGAVDASACAAAVGVLRGWDGLQRSGVGAGFIGGGGSGSAAAAGGFSVSERRTSSSGLVDPGAPLELQDLENRVAALGHELLGEERWSTRGQLPGRGERCFEKLQVAHYREGEEFKSHDDAFPADAAAQNGFQRAATLLLYLSDCAAGGETAFDRLPGVSLAPRAGTLVIFFPALPGGEQDPLALHAALPVGAGAEKFVAQQWVADWAPGPGAAAPAPPAAPDGRALARMALKRAKGGRQGGAEGKTKAGFGVRRAPSKGGSPPKPSKKSGGKGFGR